MPALTSTTLQHPSTATTMLSHDRPLHSRANMESVIQHPRLHHCQCFDRSITILVRQAAVPCTLSRQGHARPVSVAGRVTPTLSSDIRHRCRPMNISSSPPPPHPSHRPAQPRPNHHPETRINSALVLDNWLRTWNSGCLVNFSKPNSHRSPA